MKLFTKAVLWPLFVLVAAWVVYRLWMMPPPPRVTLRAKDWKCTHSHIETHAQMIGKIVAPVTREVCDQYTRR